MEISRRQIAADALGSVRAAGLEPGPIAETVLEYWAAAEITDDQLAAIRQWTIRSHLDRSGRSDTI